MSPTTSWHNDPWGIAVAVSGIATYVGSLILLAYVLVKSKEISKK